ncbi:hypothetical protein GCM10023215_54910 [Pseudonocardia yuanmonensis]|uniref:Uncharacterized protein n=1 Tax=Pseudonocardia yuanmonensis TaxID=1095914 RepID=A0ABP8XFH3_9PSEU
MCAVAGPVRAAPVSAFPVRVGSTHSLGEFLVGLPVQGRCSIASEIGVGPQDCQHCVGPFVREQRSDLRHRQYFGAQGAPNGAVEPAVAEERVVLPDGHRDRCRTPAMRQLELRRRGGAQGHVPTDQAQPVHQRGGGREARSGERGEQPRAGRRGGDDPPTQQRPGHPDADRWAGEAVRAEQDQTLDVRRGPGGQRDRGAEPVGEQGHPVRGLSGQPGEERVEPPAVVTQAMGVRSAGRPQPGLAGQVDRDHLVAGGEPLEHPAHHSGVAMPPRQHDDGLPVLGPGDH